MKGAWQKIILEETLEVETGLTPVFLVHADPNDPAILAVWRQLMDELKYRIINHNRFYSDSEMVIRTQFDFESRMTKDRLAMMEAKALILPPLKLTANSHVWDWRLSYLALEQVRAALAQRPRLTIQKLDRQPDGRLMFKTVNEKLVGEIIADNYERAHEQYQWLISNLGAAKE